MCDSSQTSCSSIDTVRSRSAAERSDEPQAAGHRFGANATADYPSQGAQRQVRAALAATVVGTQSVLETRSSDELYLSWQDERRTALGRYDSANLQDGSRTSSYQEAGYSTYDEAFLRNRTARSRSGSNGYQQAVRTQQFYNYYDLFTLPQTALGFDPQPDRLASRSAMPQVDRSLTSVTIGTVADEQAR